MATAAEVLSEIADQAAHTAEAAALGAEPDGSESSVAEGPASNPVLDSWVAAQAINVTRHAAALRPFRQDEFGTASSAPTAGHIEAVNHLISGLRRGLLTLSKSVTKSSRAALAQASRPLLQTMVNRKEKAQTWVQGIEKIWDFYFELFGQRQTRYAHWLLSCDRIALDCYRAAYMGLGTARTIPSPPPFSFMRTGFAPATFRRGIPLKRLGKQLNPFPLVQLPYHRMINPWTLGAVLHEVSHNLQSDLGLSKDIPRRIALRLLKAGLPKQVAMTWTRWNREMFADMSALLLGGPEVVASLMDVIGRGTDAVVAFNPKGVHPTPYLRLLNSVELLRRMGFKKDAERYRRAWQSIYSPSQMGNIPPAVVKSYRAASELAVDTMCYQPYPSLGKKSLAQVIPFGAKEQQMIEEAARRIAKGTDPGIVPERFTIAAIRFAFEKRLARPNVIAKNFYKLLSAG